MLCACHSADSEASDNKHDSYSEKEKESAKRKNQKERKSKRKKIKSTDEDRILPESMDDIARYEGLEVEHVIEGDYEYPILWGEWVLDAEEREYADPTDTSINAVINGKERSIECFPRCFSFTPPWVDDASFFSIQIGGPLVGLGGQDYVDYKEGIPCEYNPFGVAAMDLGLGSGSISYCNEKETDKGNKGIDYASSVLNPERTIYSLNGEMLSVGLTGISIYNSVNKTDIYEIDYKISYSGNKLTLYYNDESATYVPRLLYINDDIKLNRAGTVNPDVSINGIVGVQAGIQTYDNEINILGTESHDGYIPYKLQTIGDDKLMITDESGVSRTFEYFYTGYTITLTDEEDNRGVYSEFTYINESPNQWAYCGLYHNDIGKNPFVPLKELIEAGFLGEYDDELMILPGMISDVIKLSDENGSFYVKVCNNLDQYVSIEDCRVCYVMLTEESNAISPKLYDIGDDYDHIRYILEPPIISTDNSLRYKGHNLLGPFGTWEIEIYPFEERPLFESGDKEVVLKFQNGILEEVIFEDVGLLYSGLEDNVDINALEQMESSRFSGVIEIRDTILDKIVSGLQSNNIDVDIDAESGEVILSNNVLFESDSAELSDEGKTYLEDFIKVYASVITEEDVIGFISEIRFEGHTDSVGSYSYNMDLSQRRAEAVLDYSIESIKEILSSEKVDEFENVSNPIGYSFTDPVYGENGEEDADASRRVAIKFLINLDNIEE